LVRSQGWQGLKINESYVSRILRLTRLAPDVVEAISTGDNQPAYRAVGVDWAVSARVRWGAQSTALAEAAQQ
jgi:hypothetical protein